VAVRAGAGRARRGLAEEACRAARGPALRRRGGRRTVRRGGLLDAPDLGLGVVALDLHPPHAEDAGPDPDPGTGAAHAGQGRIVHLLPHLAIVEAVALAAAEAGELADDAGHDRLVRTEVEEAPVLLHDLAAAFLAGLLRGSGDGGSGLLLHAAVEPGVQACQFLRGQLVQAGGAELLRRHRLLDRRRLL